MSSPTAADPAGSISREAKKRKGVRKVLYNVKTVFKWSARTKKGAPPAAPAAAAAVVR